MRTVWPILILVAAAAQPAAGQSPRGISKQLDFPLQIKGLTAEQRSEIREFRLYARSGGGPWEKVGDAGSRATSIRARVPADGVYDLALQTVYTDGAVSRRVSELTAQDRYLVDTQRPEVDLEAVNDGLIGRDSVRAGVRWSVRDANLDWRRVVLEVMLREGGRWQTISRAFEPRRGEYFWKLSGGETLRVRLRAGDAAGNIATSSVVVTPPGGAGRGLPTPPPTGGEFRPRDREPAARVASKVFYVNSLNVRLNSAIEVGKSGIGAVELYYKPQGGRWAKAAAEVEPSAAGGDRQSRVLKYTAPAEGTYGFTIVARSGVGLGEKPPRDGEEPGVWVEVDVQKPRVRLTGVEVRPEGDTGNRLTVRWSATD